MHEDENKTFSKNKRMRKEIGTTTPYNKKMQQIENNGWLFEVNRNMVIYSDKEENSRLLLKKLIPKNHSRVNTTQNAFQRKSKNNTKISSTH